MISSVGACVVVVEFVKCRAVELAVVDEDNNDFIVGAVVVASVAVVLSFRLQRGSSKREIVAGINVIGTS